MRAAEEFGAGVRRPREVGWFTRLRAASTGLADRFRYRDDVADGNHTHYSRLLEARSNAGLAAVDRWERRMLRPIELRLATLAPEPVDPSPSPTVGAPPGDDRARVRWAQAKRQEDGERAAFADRRAAYERDEEQRRVLTVEHRNVRLYATDVRLDWVAWYDKVTSVYGRWRVGRRGGLRPAAESRLPRFTVRSDGFRSHTEADGTRRGAEGFTGVG